MKIISREDLKAKLDRGDDIKLIMALDRHAYERMHIPGSLNFHDMKEAMQHVTPDDEIVVYCSNPMCPASINAYMVLRSHGYDNLYRYAGGLLDWQEAGYPLEGRDVLESPSPAGEERHGHLMMSFA